MRGKKRHRGLRYRVVNDCYIIWLHSVDNKLVAELVVDKNGGVKVVVGKVIVE